MYYFIVNPNSRSGRGRSIWNEIHQQLMLRGIDFQYCLTRYSGHAAEIASDACALGTESEPCLLYTSTAESHPLQKALCRRQKQFRECGIPHIRPPC